MVERGLRRRLRSWLVLALAAMVLGIGGSLFVSSAVARSNAARSLQSLRTTSTHVVATLSLSMQHEQDLVVSAAGFIAGDPGATNAQFARWARSVRAFERYPEITGFGHSVIVPAAELAAFVARVEKDPAGLGPGGRFSLVPPGRRAFYCLPEQQVARTAADFFPAGYDFCSGTVGTFSLAARDSGQPLYTVAEQGGTELLGAITPIYAGGAEPATVAARRALFLGWVGLALQPSVVLEKALEGSAGIALTMRYGAPALGLSFRSGRAEAGWRSISQRLANGWVVTVAGSVSSSSILADDDAVLFALGGTALSIAVAILLFVLATGQMRARQLVALRTAELRHQAMHDPLTGLPNRALIADRAEQLLRRCRRAATVPAALFVDLDGFKNVNDSLGHTAGDALLVAVAERLAAGLRQCDTIGRMGGDEFIVLVETAPLSGGPELVAERLLELMGAPFELAGTGSSVVASASIGLASGDRPDVSSLLRDADLALYRAKAAGKNCYQVFRPQFEIEASRRYELEVELRTALEHGQFRLVYQPIYDLGELSLVGVEALLRWDHPLLGEVRPAEFVPLLESSGKILEVGRFVLDEACAQVASWRRQLPELRLSVNISSRQLERNVVVDDVRAALAASGLDAGLLTIEVSESSLIADLDVSAERLHALKALGVQIAVDDFGSGYVTLACLKRFPVDCLKIDRTFTESIVAPTRAEALVHTLVQLGKDLGVRTVAEGVETSDQLDYVRAERVDEIQGFLLACPLDPEAFAARFVDVPAGWRHTAAGG
ncbi:MAG TPA: EAL domain-containing protein [Acidimicrobiales bacterium]|nr:EAL domain-containing protein [Acidimicrobiales bacterium]